MTDDDQPFAGETEQLIPRTNSMQTQKRIGFTSVAIYGSAADGRTPRLACFCIHSWSFCMSLPTVREPA